MRNYLLLAWMFAAIAAGPATAQTGDPGCVIGGTITSGSTPLPGVVVSLIGADGKPIVTTSTGVDGAFVLPAPAAASLTLRAELLAFAPVTRSIAVDAAHCQQRVDLTMTLASRAPAAVASASPTQATAAPARQAAETRGAGPAERRRPDGNGQAPGASRAQRQGGGFQSVELFADQAGGGSDEAQTAQPLLPPGFSADNASESVTSLGGLQAAGPAGFGQRPDFFGGGPGGAGGFGAPDVAAGLARGGGFGPGGGGPGGPGGGFGGPGISIGRMRDTNRIRGSIYQSFDSASLDAAPFSLNGEPTTKPGYYQQRFGATIGGPLVVPKVVSSPRSFFFLNYTGNHASNPFDGYATVPTAAERSGDLAAFPTTVVDPLTGQPFPGNQIPASRINPSAQSLLNLMPLPNQAGTRQNFLNATTTATNLDDVNFRLVHNFGDVQPGRPGGRGGFGGGRFGGGGGDVKNLNVGVHFRRQDTNSASAFPELGGSSQLTAWDVPVSYSFSSHGFVNTLRGDYNHQRTATANLFGGVNNVAGAAGILGASADPFDWGAPSLQFSSFTSLNDIAPSLTVNQTVSFGDQMIKTTGPHTIRWGGDYRDIRMDSRSDPNARGSFVFTGLYSGLDFADFLLGMPQQASVQLGAGLEQFRQTSWDLYVQDDWRVRDTVTINAGLRYEYVSPFAEAQNRLVTLDTNGAFTAAAPVEAGQTGPFSGAFPSTIVNPDRNNFAPRVGVAWRPTQAQIVRFGYGISYSTNVYQSIAQQLANQPPFAFTNTVVAPAGSPLALGDALLAAPTGTTTNSYGVDPNYTTPYVQIWTVDWQRDLARTWNIGVGYIGTKGSSLDLMRAPNRTPDGGLRIDGVEPFLWESSGADSIMNALSLRVRKRLTKGIAFGATYTLSKAIDDASSIAGGAVVVAQNDQNLAAERGLSSFDQRHRFGANMVFELPFGADRRWFTDGLAAALLGNWTLNVNAQFASGTPFTAHVLSNAFEVSGGTNGTLRANYNDAPIAIADPTTMMWFNTAAFSMPAAGTFGTAGRNTIIGPGTSNVNFGVTRDLTLGENRILSLQVMASNVFNTPQYATIDTVVNSPTFGQVLTARAPRRLQVLTRFRF